jgi:hypothetical protein
LSVESQEAIFTGYCLAWDTRPLLSRDKDYLRGISSQIVVEEDITPDHSINGTQANGVIMGGRFRIIDKDSHLYGIRFIAVRILDRDGDRVEEIAFV